MQVLGAGGLREFQAAVQMSHVAGGSPLAPVTQNQSFGLPHGLQSLAAHHGLANSEALSAFPFAVKPTNLMKPSQCKPRGLLEKDSSTTLFRSSRLHHFHFTAFQREIIKQNYKHNEERKKEGKTNPWVRGVPSIPRQGCFTHSPGQVNITWFHSAGQNIPGCLHLLLEIRGNNNSLSRNTEEP